MRAKIETSLAAQAPVQLVKALLDAYAELKDNFNFEDCAASGHRII